MNEKLRQIFLLFHYSLSISFINQSPGLNFLLKILILGVLISLAQLVKTWQTSTHFFIMIIPGYFEPFLRD